MTHYRMLDSVPSVVITSKKNELKVYQGNEVYLNNGDNFELRLFNPLREKIGIEIIFNGIKKGDSYLVLNPGQDVTLDRFLDEQRKMVFETYEIDGNNSAAMKAIEQNGLITFNFYKEVFISYYGSNYNNVNINYNFPPEPHNYFSNNSTIGTLNTNTTTNITYSDFSQSTFTNITPTSFSNNIETGRVEKGDISNQQLKRVNLKFESTSFHSISYRMLPNSSKSQNINEIRQYCSHCGYRLRKQSWSYCPKCGLKI